MGAKTWMLVSSEGSPRELLAGSPTLMRDETSRLASQLFPRERLEQLDDGDLSYTCPPDDEIHIGCYPGVSIVAAKEFAIDYPSKLEPRFLEGSEARTVYLHAMHSVVDWFAFAIWRGGKLERSLSVSPDRGVFENIGQPLPFEMPYWSGQHPAVDPADEDVDEPYPLPFHPLELGEAALSEFFGYQLEGYLDASLLEPEELPLLCFKRKRSKFRFW